MIFDIVTAVSTLSIHFFFLSKTSIASLMILFECPSGNSLPIILIFPDGWAGILYVVNLFGSPAAWSGTIRKYAPSYPTRFVMTIFKAFIYSSFKKEKAGILSIPAVLWAFLALNYQPATASISCSVVATSVADATASDSVAIPASSFAAASTSIGATNAISVEAM